ncbi:MAG: biotin/lipoyl-binding carrier protein [Acidimicrobiales bacterium]|nr:biotin/lipoyl-binding carrier protein [Acidimicrobiales bacterium]
MIEVRAEIAANVWQVRVAVGDTVEAGKELVILESMKMEIPVEAPSAGRVRALHVEPDQSVKAGDLICEIEPA